MSCFPESTRRDRFQRWREYRQERIWRFFHPRQAKAQDDEHAAMFKRIAPALKASASTLFDPQSKIAIRVVQQYDIAVDMAPRRDDWYFDPPFVPVAWYRRVYWRVSGWTWRVIEAI